MTSKRNSFNEHIRMYLKRICAFVFLCLCVFGILLLGNVSRYSWMSEYDASNALMNRIAVPQGYARTLVQADSFEDWLRRVPLISGKPPVYLYNGQEKWNQNVHYAVINIDVGKDNLQQCADAVIRLRAEYLYSTGKYQAIHFNFTSGDRASFIQWADGLRPIVKRNKVRWAKLAQRDYSYQNFRRYLNTVFLYAGTYSLNRELQRVTDIRQLKIGDVFIQPGFPGHAMIVVDMAVNIQSGKKIFLLAQSYMPAQQIHIVINPDDSQLSPWYSIDFGTILNTPEWIFHNNHLKRWMAQ
jgi:Domain of unknown function (4846)